MNDIFSRIRPLYYVLAAVLRAAGVFLMVDNMNDSGADLAHPLSTTSAAMIPVFLLVTLPILFRRINILGVIGITAVTTLAHVLAFGWITRCGVVLPLAFALGYAVARYAGARRNHLAGLAGIVVLLVVMLARDASIDTVVNGLLVALPGTALFYGIGLLVQNRVTKQSAHIAPADQRLAA